MLRSITSIDGNGVADLRPQMIRVCPRNPCAFGRQVERTAFQGVHVVELSELLLVDGYHHVHSTAFAVGLLQEVRLLEHLRRRIALLSKRCAQSRNGGFGIAVRIRDHIEAVHVLIMAVVALHHVVVERYGGHDERCASSHAHYRAQHTAFIVDAIVHDGLDEQRQLIPDAPFLVEARFARRRLLAAQELDGVLFEDLSASEICRAQHQHKLDSQYEDEQSPSEVGRIWPENEHAAQSAADDRLDKKERYERAYDCAHHNGDPRIPQEAGCNLALTETERLLRSDLRYLLVDDTADGEIGDEKTHDDEQGSHRYAQVVRNIAERGNLDGSAVVRPRHDRPIIFHHLGELRLGGFQLRLAVGNLLLALFDLLLSIVDLRLAIGELLLALCDFALERRLAGIVLVPSVIKLGDFRVVFGLRSRQLGFRRRKTLSRLAERHIFAFDRHRHILGVLERQIRHEQGIVVILVGDIRNFLAVFLGKGLYLRVRLGAALIQAFVVLLLGYLAGFELLVALLLVCLRICDFRFRLGDCGIRRVDPRLAIVDFRVALVKFLLSIRFFGFTAHERRICLVQLGLPFGFFLLQLCAAGLEPAFAICDIFLGLRDVSFRLVYLGLRIVYLLLSLAMEVIVALYRQRRTQSLDRILNRTRCLLVVIAERRHARKPVAAHVHDRIPVLERRRVEDIVDHPRHGVHLARR